MWRQSLGMEVDTSVQYNMDMRVNCYTVKNVYIRTATNVKFSIQIFGCHNERMLNDLVTL